MIFHFLYHFKPFVCPGCKDASREMVCDSCIGSMRKNHGMIQSKEDGIRGIFPVFISYTSTHHILTHWKDYGGKELKKLLFSPSPDLLSEMVKMNFDFVIPIPQNEVRSLKRGHASAFEVARFFAEKLDLHLETGLILKKISMPKQADLNEWERRYSENPFECAKTFDARKILLIDDFITTGSTLEKAANTILEFNPNSEIYAASLGWKPRKSN